MKNPPRNKPAADKGFTTTLWLTEEKANEKACPIFALAFFLTSNEDERLIDDACQSSRCAWWRWHPQPGIHGTNRIGYCGHAGKPEEPEPRREK